MLHNECHRPHPLLPPGTGHLVCPPADPGFRPSNHRHNCYNLDNRHFPHKSHPWPLPHHQFLLHHRLFRSWVHVSVLGPCCRLLILFDHFFSSNSVVCLLILSLFKLILALIVGVVLGVRFYSYLQADDNVKSTACV